MKNALRTALIGALALVPIAVATHSAEAFQIYWTMGRGAQLRSGPSTRNASLGVLSEGTAVTIFCQAHGEKVSDRGYSSDVWDSVVSDAGSSGWVSDLYVNTQNIGTFSPGIPLCSGWD